MKLILVVIATLLTFAHGKPHRSAKIEDGDIIFRLFTRKNPLDVEILTNGDYESFANSSFEVTNPVKFYAHGRMSEWENPEMVEAFLTNEDVNVILIDWTKISNSNSSDAPLLIESARLAGVYIGGFIDWLSTLGVLFSNIHVIGFSIGSHVAGYSARNCQNGVVEFVTGLDPAIRDFEDGGDHINTNDGVYVEIFHTSYAGGGSFINPIGTADFYPNGGATQPGCDRDICNHERAVELFIESIVSDGFVSLQCNNFEETVNGTCVGPEKVLMGGTGRAKNITGIYYLTTNEESPFAQGDF